MEKGLRVGRLFKKKKNEMKGPRSRARVENEASIKARGHRSRL